MTQIAQTTAPATPSPQVATAPAPTTDQPTSMRDWSQILESTGNYLQRQIDYLSGEWTLYQLAIFLVSLGIAFIVSRIVRPFLERRIRYIVNRPTLVQLLVMLKRRFVWFALLPLLWTATLILREVTWPSRSYLLYLASLLVTTWVLVAFVSWFIRNKALAKIFAVTVWSVLALWQLDLLQPAAQLLDRAALSIGNVRISLLMVINGVVLLAGTIWLASTAGEFIDRKMRNSLGLTPTLQVLIGKVVKFFLILVAVLASVSAIGIDLSVLTVFSGALGLGIGFGLQKVAANLMSGVIILLDKSIKPGDVISIDDRFGWITSLRGRYVSLVTRDGVEYLVPNEHFISEKVVNWSFSNRQVRQDVRFGVSYDADPHHVREIVVDAVKDIDRILGSPAPVCHVTGFGDSSIDFICRFWIRDPEGGLTNIRGQVFLAIWDVLKAHEIEIPFPHREVIMSSKEQAPKHEPHARVPQPLPEPKPEREPERERERVSEVVPGDGKVES